MRVLDNYECEGQMTFADVFPDIWFGRTSPEHSVQTKEKTLGQSSKKRQGSSIKTPLYLCLRGGRWTPSGCIVGDGWSIAWRVHDAQFWGVPQRRKRIALVADFGGQSAPEILFERKGVSGDIESSGEKGQGIATTSEGNAIEAISFQERAGCAGGGKGILIQNERTGALSTLNNQSVLDAKVYGISAYESNSMKSGNPHSGIYEADTTRTLDNNGGNPACNQGGMIVLEGNGSRPSHQGDGYKESEVSYTLNSVEQHGVCTYQKTTGALTPGAHPGSYNGQDAYNDMLVVGGVQNRSQQVKPDFF